MLNDDLALLSRPERSPPASQSQQVFDLLREKISMMELPPGERLSEVDLMGQLGVGRTPFREAIQRLVQHGLVISTPYQSPVVAPLQAVEVSQIVEVRTILECAAVRAAAERATAGDQQAIVAANNAYNDSIDGDDRYAIIKADAALHDTIAQAGHNPHLRQAISWNRDFGCRLWVLAVERADQPNTKKHAHDPIVNAVCNGDPDAAEGAMRAHIELFRHRLQQLLNGERPVPAPAAQARQRKGVAR